MFHRTDLAPRLLVAAAAVVLCLPGETALAQFSVVTSAETRPQGSGKLQQSITQRSGKQHGDYTAYNMDTSIEYGLLHDFTAGATIKMQGIDTSGLLVPGYVPGDEDYTLDFFGLELSGKHKFLNTATDIVGLAAFWKANYSALDKHSGKDKRVLGLETGIALQKYFLEGQLTWRGTAAVKAIHATRGEVATTFTGDGAQATAAIVHNGQPLTLYFPDSGMCDEEGESFTVAPPDVACFEWPNFPEMEIELKLATGFSYRFTNNWYISVEALYEEEYETEVDRERHSLFMGPGLHYEGRNWAASLGWLTQVAGGGEKIDPADDLHLIEKTEEEIRLKIAYNF